LTTSWWAGEEAGVVVLAAQWEQLEGVVVLDRSYKGTS